MHTETEFQVQPSFSTEALEILMGANLDRVHATNRLSGTEPVGQRSWNKNTTCIIHPPSDGGPRRPPVGTKWQPVRVHSAGNSSQVRRMTGLPDGESRGR